MTQNDHDRRSEIATSGDVQSNGRRVIGAVVGAIAIGWLGFVTHGVTANQLGLAVAKTDVERQTEAVDKIQSRLDLFSGRLGSAETRNATLQTELRGLRDEFAAFRARSEQDNAEKSRKLDRILDRLDPPR